MNSLVFYFGAAGLYTVGAFCFRHTSRCSRAGGDGYLRRHRRRIIAQVLVTAATLCLATAVMIQYVSNTR